MSPTTQQGISITIDGRPYNGEFEDWSKAWFFTVQPVPRPVAAKEFGTSIHLMSEALRAQRLGKKDEANALAKSAARLVAQRGEAEVNSACPEVVDAAVAMAFSYLFEASADLRRTSGKEVGREQALHKAAQAWASIQPYLLNALAKTNSPLRDASPWMMPIPLEKDQEALCIALARTAATLRSAGDNDSANALREWKHALCAVASAGAPLCDDQYPEIVPNPTDTAAPLWKRGIDVPGSPQTSSGTPTQTSGPKLK